MIAGRVSVHLPGDRVGTEQAWIAGRVGVLLLREAVGGERRLEVRGHHLAKRCEQVDRDTHRVTAFAGERVGGLAASLTTVWPRALDADANDDLDLHGSPPNLLPLCHFEVPKCNTFRRSDARRPGRAILSR